MKSEVDGWPVREPRSGRQYLLKWGGYRAAVASVGATVRSLSYEGRDLILPFAPDEIRPGNQGAVLAPWPNRVIGGRYNYGGRSLQLPLNEVDRGNALHGLVLWTEWTEVALSASAVELATVVQPSDGYPFRVGLRIRYSLGADGLTVSLRARNLGTDPAPFGASSHPYLVAPGDPAAWTLSLQADTYLDVDERLAPTGDRPVAGDYDLRSAPALGTRFLDNAFGAVARGPLAGGSPWGASAASVELRGTEGAGVAVDFGPELPWVQVYTGALTDPSAPAVAVEPMTCPPDAFNSGRDLLILAPEEEAEASWRLRSLTWENM